MEFYELDRLSNEVRNFLSDISHDVNLDELYRYGGASGGARPKVHVDFQNEGWIVKFPATFDPKNMGILEYEANQLAEASGIHVAKYQLFPSKISKGYFGSKRFDREGDRRIHMISLSALLETTHRIPNLDYAHLFQVIQRISVNREDLYEAYRRMCFNVFFENKDDHGKNISFIYDEEKNGYRLAPAYDLTRTKLNNEHEMTVLGKGNPTEIDLLAIAREFKLSIQRTEQIITHVKRTLEGK